MARFLRSFSSLKPSPVKVYESPDFEKLSKLSVDFVRQAVNLLGDKYHQFVPFYLESVIST